MTDRMKQVDVSLRDMIAYIRVRLAQGGFTHREGVATCPAELMLNIDAILAAAERGTESSQRIFSECDHRHFDYEKHGRRCTCGAMMVDFGD